MVSLYRIASIYWSRRSYEATLDGIMTCEERGIDDGLLRMLIYGLQQAFAVL